MEPSDISGENIQIPQKENPGCSFGGSPETSSGQAGTGPGMCVMGCFLVI